jgi:IS30 family transposase
MAGTPPVRSDLEYATKIGGATSPTVVTAVTNALFQLPETIGGTLTWGCGVDMTDHAQLTAAACRELCDAYRPLQRGTNVSDSWGKTPHEVFRSAAAALIA